jgi:hypothetical protein
MQVISASWLIDDVSTSPSSPLLGLTCIFLLQKVTNF